MGTLFRIALYARDAEQARIGFRAAFDRVKQLDQILSDYKPDSELMQVCRSAFDKPVAVGSDLFAVLEASQRLARETGGAFDITLGPVVRLWREARASKRLPPADEVAKALRSCGYEKLILGGAGTLACRVHTPVDTFFHNARPPQARVGMSADTAGKSAYATTVRLLAPGMQLDLGAIAKGYAADQALRTLREKGIERALVAASGDIAAGEAPPGTSGWKVGIDCPDSSASRFSKVLTMRNAAVSTSGDTEQYLESSGIRYSHIIDPRTGMGLTQRLCVTVTASASMEADSLATAVSVIAAQHGDEAALKLMESHPGASARIIDAPGTSTASRSTR